MQDVQDTYVQKSQSLLKSLAKRGLRLLRNKLRDLDFPVDNHASSSELSLTLFSTSPRPDCQPVANLGKQNPGWRVVRHSDAIKTIKPSSMTKSVSFCMMGFAQPPAISAIRQQHRVTSPAAKSRNLVLLEGLVPLVRVSSSYFPGRDRGEAGSRLRPSRRRAR
jgi:hypothetical protein